MINDNIHPIDPTGFRTPAETEDAISETLKLCGVSGEDASMMFIEVMKKLGKSDDVPACCRYLAEEKPPAQPDVPDTNVGDIISRQAAVELVMKYCPDDDGTVQCDGDIRGLLDELENLPSAQPETATVTIGRTKGGVTMWYECDACGEPVDQKDNYCRNCGRKLKHD